MCNNSGQGIIDAKTKKTSQRTATSKSKYTKWTGTVGKYKVTVFLDANGNGYNYYGNGSKGKLQLRGKLINDNVDNSRHYYLMNMIIQESRLLSGMYIKV